MMALLPYTLSMVNLSSQPQLGIHLFDVILSSPLVIDILGTLQPAVSAPCKTIHKGL